jgi:hypothetical protein
LFAKSLTLYEPIQLLKPLAPGIGVVDGPLVFMAYPGLSFLKIPFTTRMTVVELGNGDLWLHSPTAFDPTLAASLAARGRIAHLVSPNKIHYAGIQAWKQAFPEALAWASPGVRERARQQGAAVAFDRDLGAQPPEAWRDDLQQTVIPGSFMLEIVFFHAASRTLILTDAIENFELEKIKPPLRWLMKAAGAYHPHGQMPLDLRATFLPHREEARAAAERMIAWKPERIVLSHGRLIEDDPIAALRYAFRWAL